MTKAIETRWFGVEIDGNRANLKFRSAAKAKEQATGLISEGRNAIVFEYSAEDLKPLDAEQAGEEFMRLGVQYYVAARSAAWAGLLPVCGNLYHHSLEMFLKSGLSFKYSLNDLHKKFCHRLCDIWREFKIQYPSGELEQFDTTIADISKFEEVRYPDNVLERGAQMVVDFRGSSPARISEPSSRPEPLYKFYFDDIDRLIGEICHSSSRDPLFFTLGLKSDVRKMLRRDNPVADRILGSLAADHTKDVGQA